MRFVYATWPAVPYQGAVLTYEGAKDRLVSYYFIKDLPEGSTQKYVAEGILEAPPPKKKKGKQ